MLRIHTDDFVPKFQNGNWVWNDELQCPDFEKRQTLAAFLKKEYLIIGSFKFHLKINQIEEMIFRQEFQRPETTRDADVILIMDIKNLVLFLSPMEILTPSFIKFMHTKTVDKLLHALIIYMEHFLKFVEFLMIRRDDITGESSQLQSHESTTIKQIYSEYLSQYRLLLSREYSTIILGEGEMKPFHHLKPILNISFISDKTFYEAFLAVIHQIVWIALHRRANDVIDAEIGRLFRSEHFRTTRTNSIEFTKNEMSMLYGKNYKRVNYRAQNSPLIQEISNVSKKNLPILWIGERKYRGTDLRIHQLEMEYIVPDCQLNLINVTHGILGHPKKLYDTMLNLNWDAVRYQNYTKDYDPYRIVQQPFLEIPKLDAEQIRKNAETFESYYEIVSYHEPLTQSMYQKWIVRDRILTFMQEGGMITNVWKLGKKEAENQSYGPSVEEIITKFKEQKSKLRKN